MGESKLVTKEEIHDLAREFGAKLGEAAAQVRDQDARIQSLAIAFDCLVTVLEGELVRNPAHYQQGFRVDVGEKVKAELAKRKAAIEAKANDQSGNAG